MFLDGRTLDPLEANADGTAARGHDGQAEAGGRRLLNETFGIDALEAGLVIGVAKITINTK